MTTSSTERTRTRYLSGEVDGDDYGSNDMQEDVEIVVDDDDGK